MSHKWSLALSIIFLFLGLYYAPSFSSPSFSFSNSHTSIQFKIEPITESDEEPEERIRNVRKFKITIPKGGLFDTGQFTTTGNRVEVRTYLESQVQPFELTIEGKTIQDKAEAGLVNNNSFYISRVVQDKEGKIFLKVSDRSNADFLILKMNIWLEQKTKDEVNKKESQSKKKK